MIPKIIHLCWISGDKYPNLVRHCISTWKKHNPDYEVMLWDADSFDLDSVPWTREALAARKYAFIADYIRLYAVYNYGGIYLDSDVEVLKSFDSLLDKPYFLSCETVDTHMELAAFGAEKGTQWVKDALDYYQNRHFISQDGSIDNAVQPKVIWNYLKSKYDFVLVNRPEDIVRDPGRICILPCEWFCAHRDTIGEGRSYDVTENTFSVHHFTNSWVDMDFPGGMLHRLYYKITGKDWRRDYNWFKIQYFDK